jgi:hypothetical protein
MPRKPVVRSNDGRHTNSNGKPQAMALALEQMAAEQFNSLTEQVKIAVREYLERHQRMPKPGHAAHKRS